MFQTEKFSAMQKEERQKNEERMKDAIEEMRIKEQVNNLIIPFNYCVVLYMYTGYVRLVNPSKTVYLFSSD